MKQVRYVRTWFPATFSSRFKEHVFDGSEDDFRPVAPGYMWEFFSRWEAQAPDGTYLESDPIDKTAQHIFGEVWTLDQAKAGGREFKILRDNMEINGWPEVVRCAQGFLPRKDMVVIEPESQVG